MQRFLFLVSTVSARNAWDYNCLVVYKYEEKENGLQIMSLAAYTSETTYNLIMLLVLLFLSLSLFFHWNEIKRVLGANSKTSRFL